MTCQQCDGIGFVQVAPGYVDKVCPVAPPPIPDPQNDAERRVNEGVAAWNEQQRRSYAHSFFPCPGCNPEQFDRFMSGDWPTPRAKSKTGDLRSDLVQTPAERERRDLF